jgi:hypothetical protein
MFATKTRTTIVALIASSSFALSTVAPAISQAQKVQTTTHKTTKAEACSTLSANEQKANDEVLKYLEEGDVANAEASGAAAELYYAEGVREGCWTAAMNIPVSSHPVAVIGKGPGVLPTK